MAPPTFVKFMGVDVAVTDAASIKFLGADGMGYTANIAPAAIPATIVALIARGGTIGAGHPPGKSIPVEAQTLHPSGFHIGATEAGDPLIYIQFGPTGALPIQLTRKQLKDVRRLVGELDRLSAPKPKTPSH